MDMRMRFDGAQDMRDTLKRIRQGMGQELFEKNARAALTPMRNKMASNAPVRTGRTRRSITIAPLNKLSNYRMSSRLHDLSPASDHQYAMYVGPEITDDDDVFYIVFVELGTINAPAHPFIRPAFDQEAPGAMTYFVQSMWTDIEKLAA